MPTDQVANSIASPPLAATNTRLSPPSSLASCHGFVPSAWRTASSVRRSDSAASRRFATLAHAISSTSATAHSNATMTGRAWAANREERGRDLGGPAAACARQRPVHGRQLGLGRVETNVGPEFRPDIDRLDRLGLIQHERTKQVDRPIQHAEDSERGRQDADHGAACAVDGYRRAHDRRVGAEGPSPEGIADQHHRVAAGRAFVIAEQPPPGRLNTEQPKERRRHGESFNLLGVRARTHVERHAAECRGFLECVETAAPGRIADRARSARR